ncbi:tryptophan synthase subunit alpha [Thalassococcus sp. CAU 1522]|uniref:Tryptophan synthase subunit alpha n=1 Tax=Thalassococcus arenae TaxID=2851652 RepID=A0ABS6N2B6_9RHOB|nr:tryptophan synthase subunit alpha [Thalassococcus arenae]MBV2358163.1 tryptophan synthase subunit alpha [Thalassococcus arenae]
MNQISECIAAGPVLSPGRILPPTLCPLIMAGDPSLDATRALLRECVRLGVGMVELCLPFRNAFTDGPALIRAHERALRDEAGPAAVIRMAAEFTADIRIILLADSSHTLRPFGFERLFTMAAEAGFAGVLPHGLPPVLSQRFHSAAQLAGLPVVGTIYANAMPETRQQVIARASAFIYLVSTWGRSGGAVDPSDLSCQIDALRAHSALPVALGFGLKTPSDVGRAFRAGCDIAIVGSAVSGVIENALETGQDPVERAALFIADLQEETRP